MTNWAPAPQDAAEGEWMRAQTQSDIEAWGSPITLPGGTVVPGLVKPLGLSSAGEWIPEGILNAGNADPQLITIPSSYITDAKIENKQIVWDGTAYTVTRVSPNPKLGGVTIAYRLGVYRTPAPDSASVAPVGETNPGQRKQYIPPNAP